MPRLLLRCVTRPIGFLLGVFAEGVLSVLLRSRGIVVLDVGGEKGLPGDTDLALLETLLLRPRVRGVLLRLGRLSWGWADLEAWNGLVARVVDSGRFVVAVGESLGNREMVLGSAASHLWMAPLGDVGVVGPAIELRFLGDALGRVGIEVEVESVGDFKSAGEALHQSHASPENREAMAAVVKGIHAFLVGAIARGRGLSMEAVHALVSRAPLTGGEALSGGLVDGLGYIGEIDEKLEELLGGSPCRLGAGPGMKLVRMVQRLDAWFSDDPAIAVVHLKGAVVEGGDGRSRQRRIESSLVVPVLRHLARSPRVGAVVLHIDSPGGSALASDLIWREVELLKREKPVVACLGNVAASGGYYVAAAATEIVAASTTLTGSIGVIGARVPLSGALARLGIHSELVAATPGGVWFSSKGLPGPERERLQFRLREIYDTFIQRVVAGRRCPEEEIRAVAQGRVWTGSAAATNGLVDAVGGLDLALLRARYLAGIRPLQLHRRLDLHPRGKRSLVGRILEKQGGAALGLPRFSWTGLSLVLTHPWEALLWSGWDLEIR
jgi:protease-4